ncbi:hypothetical protein D3C72_368560 [compost metagenome]
MGPVIVLDKSVIQSLSPKEIDFLYRYYSLNVAPILVVEVLGDLAKPDREGAMSGKQVVELANKLHHMNSAVNEHYRTMMAYSLLGREIKMDGRPVLGGQPVVRPDGKRGVVIPEKPEERTLLNWRRGAFSDMEREMAIRWRESTKAIDLEKVRAEYKPLTSDFPATEDLGRLLSHIDETILGAQDQSLVLDTLLEEFPYDPDTTARIKARWEKKEFDTLATFAPYAFYCFRMITLFYFGLARNLIGTRATNRVDMEYGFYLPFAMCFASNDHFHSNFIPLFLRPDQSFIEGKELKGDLKSFADEWSTLDDVKKKRWLVQNGSYPPARAESITNQLWQQHCKPREEVNRGRYSASAGAAPGKMKKRAKDLSAMLSSPYKLIQTDFDEDEIDFIERPRTLLIDDPCPCRSGKPIKYCHLEQIRAAEGRQGRGPV